MAINKKLIHFKEKEEFKKRLDNNEILDTSIVFIKDTKEIYTHESEYKTVTWKNIGVPKVPVEIIVGEGVEQVKLNIYDE